MHLRRVLIALVAIGIIAAFVPALSNEIEGRKNRSVEITVDFDEVRTLAEDSGLTLEQTLNTLKEAGVTSLGLRETSIARYALEGRVSIFQGGELINALRIGLLENPVFEQLKNEGRINNFYTYIITDDKELFGQMVSRLDIAFGRSVEVIRNGNPYIIEVKAARTAVAPITVGLDPNSIKLAKNIGLRVVGRPANILMGNEAAISETLAEYGKLPDGMLSLILFDGREAGGFPDYLEQTGRILREKNMRVGFIEFFRRQDGIETLMRLTGYSGVIVHSNIRGRPVSSVVNAVKERGARLLYLRFHIEQRPYNFAEAVEFVTNLKVELARYGFYPGKANPINIYGDHPLFHVLSILGVVAALGMTILELKLKITRIFYIALFFLFISLTVLYVYSPDFALQATSIFAAIVFSTLAFVSQTVNRLTELNMRSKGFVVFAILRMMGVVLLGGVMIAGLASTRYFTSGAALFRGVTLANTLPFIPVAWALYLQFTDPGTEWTFKAAVQRLTLLLRANVKWLHILVVSIAAFTFYVYVARTGHETGMPLLPFEDEMRRSLDYILKVRPRTKEFLIAYPALIVGLTLFARGKKTWLTGVFLMLGALAPISVMNTFMHFRNPTLLSSAAFRSFNGLWLGALIGIVLVLILPRLLKRLESLGFRDSL